jgi:hypothetical protein
VGFSVGRLHSQLFLGLEKFLGPDASSGAAGLFLLAQGFLLLIAPCTHSGGLQRGILVAAFEAHNLQDLPAAQNKKANLVNLLRGRNESRRARNSAMVSGARARMR